MSKYIVIFVEGETEEELYKDYIIPIVRRNMPNGMFECEVSVINVRGAGGFKNDSIMKFKRLKESNVDKNFVVAMCYDTDIFEYASKPPINWDNVEKRIKKVGAGKVIRVAAKRSIEDWLLYDLEGLCKWLRIQVPSKLTGKTGYDKLKSLFRQKNKTYIKGKKVEGLLMRLDIDKIMNKVNGELKYLISELKQSAKQ
jgi:hypothetical protein